MPRVLPTRSYLPAGAIALSVLAGPLAPAASASLSPPEVDGRIAVQGDQKPFLVGHARGVQIYTCTATASGAVWGPATPRADLYDDHGKLIITHFAGPRWRANDGSTVKGSRVNGITVDEHSIQWLLLAATPETTASDGDRLTATSFIQRINTVGGLPPAASECTADTVGTVAQTPYTADYWFWKPTGQGPSKTA